MAGNTVGAVGMVRLEYLGQKMSATWDGPATGQSYTFGADKPRGWVDRRDVGERNKNGFLNMKDRNSQWIFRPVSDSSNGAVVSQPANDVAEPIAVVQIAEPNTFPAVAGVAEVTGTLSVAEKTVLSIPNITDMNVVEIKALDVTREQLVEMYKVELANRARKGLISYFEERLAEDV